MKLKLLSTAFASLALPFSLLSCSSSGGEKIDDAGNIVSRTTSFRLPPKLGILKRDFVQPVTDEKRDLVAGYKSTDPAQPAKLTITLVTKDDKVPPTAEEVRDYSQLTRASVLRRSSEAVEIRSNKIAGHEGTGSLYEFRFNEVVKGKSERFASLMAIFQEGAELVQYYISGPQEDRAFMEEQLKIAISVLSRKN